MLSCHILLIRRRVRPVGQMVHKMSKQRFFKYMKILLCMLLELLLVFVLYMFVMFVAWFVISGLATHRGIIELVCDYASFHMWQFAKISLAIGIYFSVVDNIGEFRNIE